MSAAAMGASGMGVVAQNLTYQVGRRRILHDVSTTFEPGYVTGLIGPNGAGKSTLLRLLAGEENPTEGRVIWAGDDVRTLSLSDLATRRAVMTQSNFVAFDFLVEEIIALGWLGRAQLLADALEEVVTLTGVSDLLGKKFNTLSGGEAQRVQFARALLQLFPLGEQEQEQARYLLLDEPTASLDVANELHLLGLVRQIAAHNVGVIVVLHDLNLAARFADRLTLLNGGEVVKSADTDAVLTSKLLSEVYNTPLQVEYHNALDRLLVLS
ncbi:MAG: heme ABC transporter ATP-binding protein [Pseudomonadota bacterium]